jgi:hypothetical protein
VIDETTVLVGTPMVGEKAQVNGHTQDGKLYADQIAILTDKENTPQQKILPSTMPTIMPPASASPIVTIVTPTTVDGMDEDDDIDDEDDDGGDDDDDDGDDD